LGHRGGECKKLVMPGLVPGIHVLLYRGKKDVDGRDKPGHDGENVHEFVVGAPGG
jgi:hypothetical protein